MLWEAVEIQGNMGAIGGAIWGYRDLILPFFKRVLVFNFLRYENFLFFFQIIGHHPPSF